MSEAELPTSLYRKTVYKSYVCDFSQTILSNLLTPQRGYWIECNTTQVRLHTLMRALFSSDITPRALLAKMRPPLSV